MGLDYSTASMRVRVYRYRRISGLTLRSDPNTWIPKPNDYGVVRLWGIYDVSLHQFAFYSTSINVLHSISRDTLVVSSARIRPYIPPTNKTCSGSYANNATPSMFHSSSSSSFGPQSSEDPHLPYGPDENAVDVSWCESPRV